MSEVEFLQINGAECEPLLHKDFELMKHEAPGIVRGSQLLGQQIQASRIRFGIKTKNAEAVQAVQSAISDPSMDIVQLGDFYPSGDEYELVNLATGRLIPPAGIPL